KKTDEVTVKGEEKVSRVQVRTLLRKFLYKQGLRDYFRVIGGKENALVVKEIKVEEEEE
ncbi:60S ribosomal protein L22, partial [Candidatus Bathyarchaeota archaeon]|nr:60S ribosomal protein L22 [Candidatus Bathyarchaeota archaeon]